MGMDFLVDLGVLVTLWQKSPGSVYSDPEILLPPGHKSTKIHEEYVFHIF